MNHTAFNGRHFEGTLRMLRTWVYSSGDNSCMSTKDFCSTVNKSRITLSSANKEAGDLLHGIPISEDPVDLIPRHNPMTSLLHAERTYGGYGKLARNDRRWDIFSLKFLERISSFESSSVNPESPAILEGGVEHASTQVCTNHVPSMENRIDSLHEDEPPTARLRESRIGVSPEQLNRTELALECIRILSARVQFSRASFWNNFTENVISKIDSRNISLECLFEAIEDLEKIRYQCHPLIKSFAGKLISNENVYTIEVRILISYVYVLARLNVCYQPLFRKVYHRYLDDNSRKKCQLSNVINKNFVTTEYTRYETWDTETTILLLQCMGITAIYDELLCKKATRRIHKDVESFTPTMFVRLMNVYRLLNRRHDTFFKTMVDNVKGELTLFYGDNVWTPTILKDALKAGLGLDPGNRKLKHTKAYKTSNIVHPSPEDLIIYRNRVPVHDMNPRVSTIGSKCCYSIGDLCLLIVTIHQLRMHKVDTLWWKKENDFDLLQQAARGLLLNNRADVVDNMSPSQMTASCFVIRRSGLKGDHIEGFHERIMHRVAKMLSMKHDSTDPITLSLPRILENIVFSGSSMKKEYLSNNVSLVSHWICRNVNMLDLKQIIKVNKYLCDLGVSDSDFYKAWVHFYISSIPDMDAEDIKQVQDTYNKARLGDNDIGRDLFWRMGLRHQDLQVSRGASNKMRTVVDRHITRIG